jgi:flagellar basal-body rod modification protein FlgD
MTPVTNGATSSQQSPATSSGAASSASGTQDQLVNEQTFLQLLVAQLQNQDPESPQDGTQFVAELAQFSSLEQEVEMRQDLDSINTTLSGQQTSTTQSNQTNPNTTAAAQSSIATAQA